MIKSGEVSLDEDNLEEGVHPHGARKEVEIWLL
jgi:hypothetical protein